MAYSKAKDIYSGTLEEIRQSGLFKSERVIKGPQGPEIDVKDGKVLNFCSNNYLGLSSSKHMVKAAKEALKTHGFGMSSVRFICGTQDVHKELEQRIARFHGKEDAILYSSCFDANTGLFETLLGDQDAIISDKLNHASIIDGIRLCKAKRFVYEHSDMDDLRSKLEAAKAEGARLIMIATDGVFSMVGDLAKLPQICDLADSFDAMVMVDESHATGFIGPGGKGSAEELGVLDRIDIITSTFGKALGGASGGFTAAKQEIVDLLRQRSRPYLFSNSISPIIAHASLRAIGLVEASGKERSRLRRNTSYFKRRMKKLGFKLVPSPHPITPIMIGDAKVATDMAARLYQMGIYVIGFSYPVVPKGEARIRVQISAAHTREQLDKAIAAFEAAAKEFGLFG